MYDNCTLNWHYRLKALYNYFFSARRWDYAVVKVELEPVHYRVSYFPIRESNNKRKVTVVN